MCEQQTSTSDTYSVMTDTFMAEAQSMTEAIRRYCMGAIVSTSADDCRMCAARKIVPETDRCGGIVSSPKRALDSFMKDRNGLMHDGGSRVDIDAG